VIKVYCVGCLDVSSTAIVDFFCVFT
jgi:hypothetical protein